MENIFMPINELIIAPVNAIKEADIALSKGILKQIATFCDTENSNCENTVMKLKNTKFLYDKIKATEQGEIKETVGLTVPTASIIPLSALKISSSVIKFNIEVKADNDKDNNFFLIGKTAPKKIRESDFLPKMRFNIKTETAVLPEGISRLIDVLDINQIPSVEKKVYINSDGVPYENQDIYSTRNNIICKINKLNILIDKINKSLIVLEKKLITKTSKNYQEYSDLKEHTLEEDKLYTRMSELKDSLHKYMLLKDDMENKLLNIEIDILEDSMGYGK